MPWMEMSTRPILMHKSVVHGQCVGERPPIDGRSGRRYAHGFVERLGGCRAAGPAWQEMAKGLPSIEGGASITEPGDGLISS
jgi:hypothetical protein